MGGKSDLHTDEAGSDPLAGVDVPELRRGALAGGLAQPSGDAVVAVDHLAGVGGRVDMAEQQKAELVGMAVGALFWFWLLWAFGAFR